MDTYAEHAAELVKGQVDVIIASGNAAVSAAQQATKTIPILANATDMLGSGFVASLAKPGGNTTGFSVFSAELDGKRQEILLEAVPGIRRMAALADANGTLPQQLQALQEAAHARGVDLSIYRVAKADEIAGAIDAAKSSGAAALNVLASAILYHPAARSRARPSRHLSIPFMAEEGGLMGYGPNVGGIFRDIFAPQLAKLLRGTKPADIPVEQPTKFELVVNLKAAKSLGLTISESFLLRADKVIEWRSFFAAVHESAYDVVDGARSQQRSALG